VFDLNKKFSEESWKISQADAESIGLLAAKYATVGEFEEIAAVEGDKRSASFR
jgi:hypothetical protein